VIGGVCFSLPAGHTEIRKHPTKGNEGTNRAKPVFHLAGAGHNPSRFIRRSKVGAVAYKRIPEVGPLSRQLAPEQAREVDHDLIAAPLSNGHQRHKTAQCRAPRPFIGIFILDYRLNPSYVAAAYRRQHLAEVFRDEVAAERIEEIARKRCKADNKWIRASLAELRQQKHDIQMGHIIAPVVELRRPVHGLLQDA